MSPNPEDTEVHQQLSMLHLLEALGSVRPVSHALPVLWVQETACGRGRQECNGCFRHSDDRSVTETIVGSMSSSTEPFRAWKLMLNSYLIPSWACFGEADHLHCVRADVQATFPLLPKGVETHLCSQTMPTRHPGEADAALVSSFNAGIMVSARIQVRPSLLETAATTYEGAGLMSTMWVDRMNLELLSEVVERPVSLTSRYLHRASL